MPDPNLTHQPTTFDSRVEIPADAPRAQGHDDQDAADAADASAQHKATVDSEAGRPDVGARAPGDHAEKAEKAKKKN